MSIGAILLDGLSTQTETQQQTRSRALAKERLKESEVEARQDELAGEAADRNGTNVFRMMTQVSPSAILSGDQVGFSQIG